MRILLLSYPVFFLPIPVWQLYTDISLVNPTFGQHYPYKMDSSWSSRNSPNSCVLAVWQDGNLKKKITFSLGQELRRTYFKVQISVVKKH